MRLSSMSGLEMFVCVHIVYESTLCGQPRGLKMATDVITALGSLSPFVSPFLTDSHTVAQLETEYYPMTRAYSTHRHTCFPVMVGSFHSFLLFSNLHKIIIIIIVIVI